jgi:uncharacterized membrane protein
MHILSRRFIAQYALIVLIYFCVDCLWIYFVARDMYQSHVSSILALHPAWSPVLGFYLVYGFGLWFLAVKPSAKPWNAAIRGAVVGLTAYGTYSLTGQALFTGWSWELTLADSAWGMFLSAVVAFLTVKLLPE